MCGFVDILLIRFDGVCMIDHSIQSNQIYYYDTKNLSQEQVVNIAKVHP